VCSSVCGIHVTAIMLFTELKITAEIPKNQTFTDGFQIWWKIANMDNIPGNMDITMTVHVGDREWTVNDPHKSTEFVRLPLEGDIVEVRLTISIGSDWSDTITIIVQPTVVTTVTPTPIESK